MNRSWLLSLYSTLLIAGSLTAADKPTKVEIGKRGKAATAATAFVDVPEHGPGLHSAFIHPAYS